MSPLEAWLYLDQMDLSPYWPETAPIPWDIFSARFKAGTVTLEDFSFLSAQQIHAFRIALDPQSYLPSIPSIDVPHPIASDLFALNEPDENALVLVTSNSRLTFDVLTALWAQGITPAYFLLVDCLGSTVDMAMIYGHFTSERLQRALEESDLGSHVGHRNLIVPGLTDSLVEDFRKITGWEVEVGPVCAAEIPLFLGDRWIPPDQA
ncbi:MAG: hypothetical protein HQ553_06675 [Chloroflexi bacterium]|nr:hypothetical protein [Chloroflexota bacterium]